MMKFARFALITALVFVLPTLAWSMAKPEFGFSDRGLQTEITETSSVWLSSGIVTSTLHTGSGNANTQTSMILPAGIQFLKVSATTGLGGWSGTATGGISWTASTTGTSGGGDNWGLLQFQSVTLANGGQVYLGLNIPFGPTIYFVSDHNAPLSYAITFGKQPD